MNEKMWLDVKSFHQPMELNHIFFRTNTKVVIRTLVQLILLCQHATSRPSAPADETPDRQRRYPNAIIIGVKKGGTRALLEFLRLNPRIRAPGPEVHFFDRHFDRGPEWYRRQMPESQSTKDITLEKTPSYFVTKTAPERVHAFNPSMKLIVVIRDPVQRAISDYTQTASKRAGMDTFEHMAFRRKTPDKNNTVLETETDEVVNTSWGAVKIGIYHRHVKRWLRFFPLRQLHFVNGERLISDPASEINRVERFLVLTPPVVTPDDFAFNATKGFPCIRKDRPIQGKTINTNSVSPPSLMNEDDSSSPTPISMRCLGKTKGRTHPTISPDLIDKLRSFYHDHNQKFYQLIGQDFGW